MPRQGETGAAPNKLAMAQFRTKAYPQRKHIRLCPDAYHKPSTWYFITVCCRNKEPRLQAPKLRDVVREALLDTAKQQRVELAAYSILPDHLHVICGAGAKGVSSFIRGVKGRSATALRRAGVAGSPWQVRFFDHKIRSHESLKQKCEYVWLNPVRRRLAARAEEYRWNGALLTR